MSNTINVNKAIVFRPIDLAKLQKLERRLHTIFEHECNGYEYKGMSARKANAVIDIQEILSLYNYGYELQPDPRGSALIIKFEGQELRI